MANGPIIDLVVEPRTGTYHDPNDQTTRRPRSDQRRSGDGLNNAVMWFQMKFIVGAAMLVTSFWLFHYLDVRWVNATAFLMLTIYIWVAGTSLKWLIAVFTFGALVRPGSETARLLAGTEAVKVWVTKWVMLVLHAVQLCALFFMVWPFEVNFGQFVMGTIALIFVGVSIVRFNITLGKWLENISFWGGIILFVLVLGSTAFGFNPFATREEARINVPGFNNNAGQQQAAAPLSDEELAAAKVVTQQRGELAAIEAERQAEADERARIARERAFEETRTPAEAGPCLRRYTDQLNCQTVVFEYHTFYDREALEDHCIIADPGEPTVQRTDLGGGQHRYSGPAGLTVQFFDAPIGQFNCGR